MDEKREQRTKLMNKYYSRKDEHGNEDNGAYAYMRAFDRCQLLAEKLVCKRGISLFVDPTNLVDEASDGLFSGNRKWEPEKRTLEGHLIYIMRSDLSHKFRDYISMVSTDTYVTDENLSSLSEHSSPTPEDECSTLQENNANRSLFKDVKLALQKNDAKCHHSENEKGLSSKIIDGCCTEDLNIKKTAVLAKEFGTSKKKIEYAKKKIRRVMNILGTRGDEK